MRSIIAVSAALALCGCATHGFSTRQLPPDTPAANTAVAIQQARALAAAQTAPAPSAPAGEASPPPITAAEAPSMYTYDPWERMNRFTYRFNARFDAAIFLPVADAYRRLPGPVRSGTHNFFANLAEPKTVVNYVLQWRFPSGLRSLGRFAVNSTLGIAGLFDLATKWDLKSEPTGLSDTLSRWGVHPGPFLVIPILGPSTVRDGVGFLGDYGLSYAINVAGLYRGYATYALGTLNAIDQRANTDFRYYATGSPFEYEMIRFLYVHRELIQDAAQHSRVDARPAGDNLPAGR